MHPFIQKLTSASQRHYRGRPWLTQTSSPPQLALHRPARVLQTMVRAGAAIYSLCTAPAFCCFLLPALLPPTAAVELTILHFNDVHARGELEKPFRKTPYGGYSRLAQYVNDRYRSLTAGGKKVILLDAGDENTGTEWNTFYKGSLMAELMNGMENTAAFVLRANLLALQVVSMRMCVLVITIHLMSNTLCSARGAGNAAAENHPAAASAPTIGRSNRRTPSRSIATSTVGTQPDQRFGCW